MNKRKICVVTGSRADYGLLQTLMEEIDNDSELFLQIIATGMHLSPEFGLTYKVIEAGGFNIDEKVEMLLSSDTAVGIAKAIGLATIGFADALGRLKPDLLVVLGDRFEILAAVQTALVAGIPVAHIAGGDSTEGAFDEAIRHSITKMSHLHFVTNKKAAQRVRQLGEDPRHIYVVGSPGIDQIKRTKLMNRNELEDFLNFKLRPKNMLVTFHPATLDLHSSKLQFQGLLIALQKLGSEFGIIFTKPNADTDGRIISEMIDEFVNSHPNSRAYVSLGSMGYFSTISHVDVVVGNSSSGLYEVPTFKKPTVNIGDRQKGRLLASSVISCSPEQKDILRAINAALQIDCSNTSNPYGDGRSSIKILQVIKEIRDYKVMLRKKFFEIGE